MRPAPPSLYTIDVSVAGPDGLPVGDAEIHSSVGGEVLRSGDHYQLKIPAAARPADGKVVLQASIPAAFLEGEETLALGKDVSPFTTIHLVHKTDAKVFGQVVDSAGRPLAGVRVSLEGAPDPPVTSDQDGRFSLPAHAATGQQVTLVATPPKGAVVTLSHPAGEIPARLVIE